MGYRYNICNRTQKIQVGYLAYKFSQKAIELAEEVTLQDILEKGNVFDTLIYGNFKIIIVFQAFNSVNDALWTSVITSSVLEEIQLMSTYLEPKQLKKFFKNGYYLMYLDEEGLKTLEEIYTIKNSQKR